MSVSLTESDSPVSSTTTRPSSPSVRSSGSRNGIDSWLIDAIDQVVPCDVAVLMESEQPSGRDHRGGNTQIHMERLRFRVPQNQMETVAKQLVSACKKAAEHREFKGRRLLRPERAISAIPINYGDGSVRVLGLLTRRPIDLAATLPQIRSALHEHYARRLLLELDTFRSGLESAASGIELLVAANQTETLTEACQTLCSKLASHLALDRVAIGCFDETLSKCRLQAMSDTVKIDRNRQSVRDIELAMLHAGRELPANVVFSPSEQPIELGRISEQWNTAVLAMPLSIGDGEAVGSVLLGGSRANIQRAEKFLTQHRGPLASTIVAQRSRLWHSGISRAWSKLFSRPGVAAAIAVIAAVVTFMIPVNHNETFLGVVEPTVRRFVAAPDDGILKESTVSPGDTVQTGQTLARLDERELVWTRDALAADLERLEKKRDSSRATSSFAESKIAELEIEKVRIEIEAINRQLRRFEIGSPIDGIVVSGELDGMEGVPVERGQALFEVAPLQNMIVEVAVPDSDVEYLAVGQSAWVTFDALSGSPLETRIVRIHPRSEIRDNENVFIARCDLTNEHGKLRPGMKCRIKVHCGRSSLWWVLFHRPMETLLRFFYP